MLVPSFCGDRKDAKGLLHQDPNWITSWWILMDHESCSHFLQVVTIADYWTLSGRRQAYLEAGRSYVQVSNTSGQHCTELKMGLGVSQDYGTWPKAGWDMMFHLMEIVWHEDLGLSPQVAPKIAMLGNGGYRKALMEHLVDRKLSHQEPWRKVDIYSHALIHLNLNPYVAGSECVCVCRSSWCFHFLFCE